MAAELTNGEALKAFCRLLDNDPKSGAVMRKWVKGGVNLPVAFSLASMTFGGVGKATQDQFMGVGWPQRGAEVRKGITQAIAGLERIERAAPETFQVGFGEMLARLRQCRDRAAALYKLKRFGQSRDYCPLAELREYVGRFTRWGTSPGGLEVAEAGPVGTAELMKVVGKVMEAWGWSADQAENQAEGIGKGLERFERNLKNQGIMQVMRSQPTEFFDPTKRAAKAAATGHQDTQN